jgi:hypothetical protein
MQRVLSPLPLSFIAIVFSWIVYTIGYWYSLTPFWYGIGSALSYIVFILAFYFIIRGSRKNKGIRAKLVIVVSLFIVIFGLLLTTSLIIDGM